MSPISFTQQGIITQCELAKILIITSDGMVEVAFPWTDDDRRDMELHLHGKFAGYRAFQVKSTMHLAHPFKANHLSIFFSVPKDRLVTHPNFWYFFGYFDVRALGFANPVFIVPSAEVHSHAAPHLDGDRWNFNFSASLDPASQDHWVPFRSQTREVGPRVLDIFGNEKLSVGTPPLPAELAGLDGLVLVGQRAR
jgi:hypothetical protein